MSVYVISAILKMREELPANAAILERFAETDKTLLWRTKPTSTASAAEQPVGLVSAHGVSLATTAPANPALPCSADEHTYRTYDARG